MVKSSNILAYDSIHIMFENNSEKFCTSETISKKIFLMTALPLVCKTAYSSNKCFKSYKRAKFYSLKKRFFFFLSKIKQLNFINTSNSPNWNIMWFR